MSSSIVRRFYLQINTSYYTYSTHGSVQEECRLEREFFSYKLTDNIRFFVYNEYLTRNAAEFAVVVPNKLRGIAVEIHFRPKLSIIIERNGYKIILCLTIAADFKSTFVSNCVFTVFFLLFHVF